jgi:hypothetical protein
MIAVNIKSLILVLAPVFAFPVTGLSEGEESHVGEYTGVVTMQLLPAKIIRINRIIEEPEPGTSYIGEEGILVEVEENPQVMANWSVVRIRYREYPEPKKITYEILSESYEISVSYHAESVEIIGDLSDYISR